MRSTLLPILAFLFLASGAAGQNSQDFWTAVSPESISLPDYAQRTHEPLRYSAFSLDYPAVISWLERAPREFTPDASQRTYRITLPLSDGSKEIFAVAKTRVMDPALEALHPEIGTYSGISVNTAGMQVRITVTPGWHFRAMITNPDKGIEYIEPVAEGQSTYYMVYDRTDLPKDSRSNMLPTRVEVPPADDELLEQAPPRASLGEAGPEEGQRLTGNPVNLKVYRFACAATGEFSQDNGGTKDLVFQKLTTFTNQLNAIYERDINIRLQLIAESYDIIFLDPVTDPYTGNEVGGWMSQNPTIMLQYLGSPDKYDVGHVFARYLGGAAIGVAGGLCCTQFKGRGCSAWYGPPYGDEFFAIIGQEIGHQWRSGHTFNQCFADSQFDYDSACEPGSGSTIMSYNGACGSNNISNGNTALFYHACSVAEIRRFVEFQEGNTCGSTLPTTNTAPMVITAYPPVTFIPVNTPFELTGSAVDAEGDQLTYAWDQIDLGPTSPLGTPQGNSPLFRWFEPTSSPTRTFPRYQVVLNNTMSLTEVLPTYNRDITFVLVARDNKAGGGGISWDTVELRSTTTAGPFLITYPTNSGVKWQAGGFYTVTWDVANTNRAPVNAQKVNIKLIRVNPNSTVVNVATLAENVPNNGRFCVQAPNVTGTNLRIRIEAADNVFFDLSDVNFTIEQPAAPALSLCPALSTDFACLPGTYTTTVSTSALGGINDPVELTASGLPAGATATFSPNPVLPGQTSQMTIDFAAGSPESTFDLGIKGTAGAVSGETSVRLSVVSNDFGAFAPESPANGASGVNPQPALRWNGVADADRYDVELASSPSFAAGTVIASKSGVLVDTFQTPVVLQEGEVYYWRVRPVNDCGAKDWSEPQVFVVAVQTCLSVEASDVPKNISANGTPTVESKITINAGGAISDVNITKIQGTHQFFKDLEARLVSPSGTEILLWKDKCSGYNGNFNFGMDDGATGPFSCPPPTNGNAYKPSSPLSALNGQNSAGIWTLRLKDNVISSGGTLIAFTLQICSNVALNAPLLVTNNPLTLPSGSNAAITEGLLKAEDPNNTPQQLTYTVMTLPANGELNINGLTAQVGDQFTQAEISSGAVRYYDYGLALGDDDFLFAVTDGEGGLVSGKFVVKPAVGIQTPGLADFDLAPNPAGSFATLSLAEALGSDSRVSVFNAAGQAVRTWQLAGGVHSLRMDLQGIPQGVYIVALENDTLKLVKKLVISAR